VQHRGGGRRRPPARVRPHGRGPPGQRPRPPCESRFRPPTFRQETGPLPPKGEPDLLLNLSIQNASGGKVTALKGGVPIVVEGQVVGAIGVGGGTGEQDAEVAKAGVQALLDALGKK
jgi:hypothetical protein